MPLILSSGWRGQPPRAHGAADSSKGVLKTRNRYLTQAEATGGENAKKEHRASGRKYLTRVHPIGTLLAAGTGVDTGIGGYECSRALGSTTAYFRKGGGDAKTPAPDGAGVMWEGRIRAQGGGLTS